MLQHEHQSRQILAWCWSRSRTLHFLQLLDICVFKTLVVRLVVFHQCRYTVPFFYSICQSYFMGPQKIDEMSQWSRSFWQSVEIFFR